VEQLAIDGWLDIVHPDDREENVKRWLHSVETGEPFFFEHRFRRFDGEYRWELSRALPQYDENGNIQMWVGTSTDIQDQKMFAAELEKQVNLRTKILRETAEDLKKTNDELSQFNYVASHDLQEPLRKIQTFITRIHEMESQLSDKGRTYFEKINESAMRMQKLTNDLLAYSRANATEKHFEQVDLNKIVSTVIEQFSHTIDALKAEIIADDLPSLKAIPFQFEQLFSNLLGNSLKFYRKDVPLKIKIGYSKINSTDIPKKLLVNPGQYHHITVADNGIGFEQEYSERIFQVFQRLHGKHDFEGTGIGLAIVKKIVDNHNGYVMAAGENGLGATFHIYLPV
jgi:light-regulated signal transduction histidine kinase (bacteriophytochrome)